MPYHPVRPEGVLVSGPVRPEETSASLNVEGRDREVSPCVRGNVSVATQSDGWSDTSFSGRLWPGLGEWTGGLAGIGCVQAVRCGLDARLYLVYLVREEEVISFELDYGSCVSVLCGRVSCLAGSE